MRAERPSWRLRTLLFLPGFVSGLLLLFWGWTLPSLRLPGTILLLDAGSILLIGGLLTVASCVCLLRYPQGNLLLGCLGIGVATYFSLGGHAPRRGEISVGLSQAVIGAEPSKIWLSPYDWIDSNGQDHPMFGTIGKPSGRFRASSRDFDVEYVHDAEGFRVVSAPLVSSPKGEIEFLGCSITYGACVAGDCFYPSILAREAWPDYRVRSLAFNGWGTTHALLKLRERLEEPNLPELVLYGFIAHHLKRNHTRSSFWQGINARFPLFDLDGEGRLKFIGVQEPSQATAPDSEETRAIEIKKTIAMLKEMADRCRAKNVPFAVVLLDNNDIKFIDELKRIEGVVVLDYARVCVLNHVYDPHPSAASHRWLAWALASDPRVAKLAGRPDLYRPSAVSTKGVPRHVPQLHISSPQVDVKITREGTPPRAWKLEGLPVKTKDGSVVNIAIDYAPFRLVVGDENVLKFRARSDHSSVVYTSNWIKDVKAIEGSKGSPVKLTPEWKEYSVKMVAIGASDESVFSLVLRDCQGTVEVSDIRIEQGGKPLEPNLWQPEEVEIETGDAIENARE